MEGVWEEGEYEKAEILSAEVSAVRGNSSYNGITSGLPGDDTQLALSFIRSSSL